MPAFPSLLEVCLWAVQRKLKEFDKCVILRDILRVLVIIVIKVPLLEMRERELMRGLCISTRKV